MTTSSTSASGVVEWLSNDPIGISGGLNQYAFCGNNPVNYRDPLGLCKRTQEATGLLLGLGLVSGASEIDRLLLLRQNTWNFMRQLAPGSPAYEAFKYQLWKTNARLAATEAASYTSAGQLTGYGALGLTGAGSSLSIGAIGGLATGAAAVGVGVGYGINHIPIGGGRNVGDALGEGLYNLSPGFWE